MKIPHHIADIRQRFRRKSVIVATGLSESTGMSGPIFCLDPGTGGNCCVLSCTSMVGNMVFLNHLLSNS